MHVLQSFTFACVLATVIAPIVSGQQQQRPATLDDLLAEIRGLRADTNHAAEATTRTQLVTARLTLHEGRISIMAQQLANVRQRLWESQLMLAPYAGQVKQAQETNSEILAPLRNLLEQVQKRDRELRAEEDELVRLIASEESRSMDFNSQLEEIERSLTKRP